MEPVGVGVNPPSQQGDSFIDRGAEVRAWFVVVSSNPIDLPQTSMSSCGGDNNPGVSDVQGATPSSERESVAK